METEKNIKISNREVILSQALEEPVDVDFTLPDYCPDIEKILKCTLTPQIYTRNISGGVLEIEGVSIVSVMYVDSVRKALRTSKQVVPFNRTVNIRELPDSHCIFTTASTEYVNCRALSPRRLVIKGSFSLKTEIVGKTVTAIPSADSFDGFQKMCVKRSFMDVTAVTEETFGINETVSVQNKPDIESIIKTVVKVSVSEHKAIEDKIMVKGELNLRLLYLSDLYTGETQCLDYVLPFSQIISCTGADSDTVNNISCQLLSYDVNASGENDEKTVSVEARINLTAICYKAQEAELVTDAYSKEYVCELRHKPLQTVSSVRPIKRSFIRKMDISSNDRGFSRILDVYNESCSAGVRNDAGTLTLVGKAGLCVIALDGEGIPFYIERTMDFTDKSDEPFGNAFDIKAVVTSVSYRIKDEHTLELRVELVTNIFVTNSDNVNIIDGIEVFEDKMIEKPKSALTLYFAEKGEALWDIAKHYYTEEQFIVEDNDLAETVLSQKEMLIIRR